MSFVLQDPASPSAPAQSGLTREPFRVALDPHLIVQNRQQLKMRVIDALADGYRVVVLDASACGYIDTSGLGVLVSLNKKCRDVGGRLVLCGLSDELRAYFEVIHLDTIFELQAAGPS